jgi:hypothetical protein
MYSILFDAIQDFKYYIKDLSLIFKIIFRVLEFHYLIVFARQNKLYSLLFYRKVFYCHSEKEDLHKTLVINKKIYMY